MEVPNIDRSKLERSADVLRALTHPLRLKILTFIHKHKDVNVNKIYNSLNLEQSITSQHLKILRENNIVNTDREGKFVYYSVNYNELSSIVESLDHVEQMVSS